MDADALLVLQLVSCYIAEIDEPILSLSSRVRQLHALNLSCTEVRHIVVSIAYPALIRESVAVSRLHTHQRQPPTQLSLALRSDKSVLAIETDLCDKLPQFARIGGFAGGMRRKMVVRILESVALGRWELVPLRRELRIRRSMLVTPCEARTKYRLRAKEVAMLPPPPWNLKKRTHLLPLEDVLDLCHERFGSSEALAGYNRTILNAVQRRAVTVSIRNARREEIAVASGDELRWKSMLRMHVEIADAERKYTVNGDPLVRDQAVHVFKDMCRDADDREAAINTLELPDLNLMRGSVSVDICDFINYNNEESMATLTSISRIWVKLMAKYKTHSSALRKLNVIIDRMSMGESPPDKI